MGTPLGIVEHLARFPDLLAGKDGETQGNINSPERVLIEEVMVDLIVLLQRYGCVISDQRLSEAKLSPQQIVLINTGIEQGQIERSTGAAAGTPRTPRL